MTLDNVQIFLGDSSEATARIYVQLPRVEPGEWRLAGRVLGPKCAHSQTLSATVQLVDRGAGPTLLAEALLPDPCFWSPELPFLYEVEVELRRGTKIVARLRQTWGLRPLGVRGQRLYRAGRPWVLRGIHELSTIPVDWSQWRAAGATVCLNDPSDEALAATSRQGVGVIAWCSGDSLARLAAVARWPSVVLVVLPGETILSAELRASLRNVVTAQWVTADTPVTLADWAQAVVADVDAIERLRERIKGIALPVFARRSLLGPCDFAAARRACDILQSDLAGSGEFAGYIV